MTSQATAVIGTAAEPARPSPGPDGDRGAALPLLASSSEAQVRYFGLTLGAWLQIGVIALLMAATFRFNLRRLYLKTNPFTGEANWGHSVVIPAIGLYYLYLNREQLFKAKVRPLLGNLFTRARLISSIATILGGLALWLLVAPHLPEDTGSIITLQTVAKVIGRATVLVGGMALVMDWGLATLLFGLIVFQYGIYPGSNDWTSDMGMVITLFGVVLTMCGWDVMRVAWFPILFLVCALPWPGLVYSAVASPLQELAARMSVVIMNLVGLDATHAGTKIFISRGIGLAPRTLNVAEACAGLRSLMTFIAVGAAVGFLSNRPLWQRILLTLSAIPIAIFCNVMRVAGQGVIDHVAGEKWSESFAHQFVGMVMLIPAFFMILGVAWLLDQIFIEEVSDADAAVATAQARRRERELPGVIVVQRRPQPVEEGK